jgi:hypothetical protein
MARLVFSTVLRRADLPEERFELAGITVAEVVCQAWSVVTNAALGE